MSGKISALKSKVGGKGRSSKLTHGDPNEVKSLLAYKTFYDEYEAKYNNILQPAGHGRAMTAITKIGKKNRGFVYAEQTFFEFVSKGSKNFTDLFGRVLESMAEAYERLSDLKSIRHTNTKTFTYDPINSSTIKELDIIFKNQRNLTKCENEFNEAEKKKEQVGDPKSIERREHAFRLLSVAKEELQKAQAAFMKDEPERIEALIKAAEVEIEYHTEALKVFQRMVQEMNGYLNTSRASVSGMQNGGGFDNGAEDHFSFSHNMNSSHSAVMGGGSIIPPAPGSVTSGPCARALYDFEAETSDDLALRKDDIVQLIEKADDQWFYGELKGARGHFPVDFVEVINPL